MKSRLKFLALFLPSMVANADDYVLGQGYNIGAWNISGYVAVDLEVPNRQATELAIDDLALFLHGRINNYLNPFFEGEYSKQAIWTDGDGVFSSGAGRFELERLYNDSYLTNSLFLRYGKMLSPVGEWNQIHAAPLVNTTIRPLTTYLDFSEYTTGISLNYATEQDNLPSVILYYQPGQEFLPLKNSSHPYRFKNVSGIQLVYAHDLDWRAGFSIQHAELVNRNERQTLLSWDGRYDFDVISLETQFSYNKIYGEQQSRQRNDEWAGYLQLNVPITEDWSLIGRGETFTPRDSNNSQQNAVFGANYRPNNALVWKLEYLLVKGGTGTQLNEGIYASFGVMF